MKPTEIDDRQTYEIIGAAMEVHRVLGPGFLEPVYQNAMVQEFKIRHILFQREVALPVFYKGIQLSSSYRADFICFDEIIVELKALSAVGNAEYVQVINYLKSSGYKRGLLINFGTPRLQFQRLVLDY